MKLGGNAGGVGAFFMRFAEAIYLYRADCGGHWGEDGTYVRARRSAMKMRGLVSEVQTRTVQDASGERLEGSLNYRIRGSVYASSEDDIGDADILFHAGRFWRVSSADTEGGDTTGSAELLSDDLCVDMGLNRKACS
ncbi:MAG: hypothetical protein ACPGVT_12040 [Maricaulaceae bacterium]